METQVEKSHYEFSKYFNKKRWTSLWHQVDEITRLEPKSVLEIGPGPGILKSILSSLGLVVHTLDLDPELKPDYVASVTNIPLQNDSFDLCCGFQVLEHMPFDKSKLAFSEMLRVSRRFVVISLPDSGRVWPYSIYVPKKGQINLHLKVPFNRRKRHRFDGQHYWEINKKGYDIDSLIRDLCSVGESVQLVKNFLVDQNPYHRFLVFQKN